MTDMRRSIASMSPEEKRRLTAQLLARRKRPRQKVAKLAQSQLAVFLEYRMNPESSSYSVAFACRIRSEVHVEALKKSLEALCDRHPAFRMTYSDEGGEAHSVLHDELPPDFEQQDVSGLSEEEIRKRVMQAYAIPLNLETGPCLHSHLFTRDPHNHILLMVASHIILDGWGFWILLEELRSLYAAELGQGTVEPPASEATFAALGRWQEELLNGAEGDRLWAYWKKELEGELPVLNLPLDRPRAGSRSINGSSHNYNLSADLAAGLRDVARGNSTTLFTVLMAAWQTLLHRYSGQDEIIVGVPTTGRTRPEFARVIGNFVNIVPIRTFFPDKSDFPAVVAQVKEKALGALAHEDFPYGEMKKRLGLYLDHGYNPIFQVSFNLLVPQRNDLIKLFVAGYEDEIIPFGPLNLSPYLITQQDGQIDLGMLVMEYGDALVGTIKFSTDLFDRATILRMEGHYRRILESIVEDYRQTQQGQPSRPAGQLDILDEEDERILGLVHCDKEDAQPCDMVHDMFHRHVEAASQAPAVVAHAEDPHRREEVSYAALNRRANQMARHLASVGVEPGEAVALCMEKGVDLIAGVLGILKAGGAYLPLDSLYPAERIAAIVEESRIRLALVHDDTAQLLEGQPGLTCVNVDALRARLAEYEDTDPEAHSEKNSLAYVTYTSGSTGKPKGVMVEHEGFARTVRAWARRYPLSSIRCHMQLANVGFDVFSADWTKALCFGARLVLVPRDILLDPPRLADLVEREGVESAEFVPAALKALLEHLKETDRRLPSLRVIYCGSDAWTAGDYRRFRAVLGPDVRLINTYGITETTIDNCSYEDLDPHLLDSEMLPIGKPFANAAIRILNAHGMRQPPGIPGEMFIGGSCVARGYYNRPELTAERYVPDPLSTDGTRLYRTGDLAKILPDGNVQYLGRADTQIKIRGFRIEPAEIENLLKKHPAVRQAVVIAREDKPGQKRLAAYVILESGGEDAAVLHDLRERAREVLPEYMVPSAILFLDKLPLSASGKIDRKALPAPADAAMDEGFAEPATAVEKTVAEIWSAILGVERVGLDDHFFALGGHSLLATQVSTRLREIYRVDVPMRDIFDAPLLCNFAERVEIALAKSGEGAAPPMAPADPDAEPLLSFAQERMWFLQQLNPESGAYNIPVSFRLRGPLDVEALGAALNDVVRRHAVLRSRFAESDGVPRVAILPELAIEPRFVDLRATPLAERQEEASRIVAESALHPFDLTAEPLVRLSIVRLDEEEHVVAVTVHHIAADHWSFGIIGREWASAYKARLEGAPLKLPALPVQYADFANWQRQWLQGPALQAQLQYWKERLSGELPPQDLPADHPRPAVQTYHGAKVWHAFSPELSKAINKLAHAQGVSLFMTMLAAVKVQLARLTGCEDVIVGMPIAGRTRREAESLVGFFINTLVLRTDVGGAPSFRQLLGRVRETALGAFAHQDMPFAKLVQELHPDRDLSRTPLFQVFVNHLNANAGGPPMDLPHLEYEPFEQYEPESKFDLTLYTGEVDGQIQMLAVYNADLFDPERIEHMVAQFESILEQAVKDATRPITEYSLLPAPSRAILPNPTQALPYEGGESVLARLNRVLDEVSSRVAVDYGERRVSCGDLASDASRLAHALRTAGVGAGDVVLLHAPRCVELVAAMLGIWKAGAAFCILDPAYPAPRLIARAEASGARALVRIEGREALDEELSEAFEYLFARRAIVLREGEPWRNTPALAGCSGDDPGITVSGEDLAYVTFTSGTTGEPKAVAATHAPLAHFLNWHCETSELDGSDRFSLLSGLSHDPLLRDVFTPLWLGASLCIPPRAAMESPARLAQWLEECAVTVSHLTPAMASFLAQARREDSGLTLPTLRHVFFGGDLLSTREIEGLLDLAPNVECTNFYGATETPQAMGFLRHAESIAEAEKLSAPIPLGTGIDGVQLLVLNESGQLCGVGEVGEICVRTAYLAQGYANDAELTAARFASDPFGEDPRVRLYRTGDVGRYRSDGAVMYGGRVDRQVSVRGFRVELGEIEAAMERLAGVRQCVAGALDGDAMGIRLAAWFVAESGRLDTEDLRAELGRHLPDYMIPASFIAVDAIPLTPNGKVDFSALPRPEAAVAEAYIAPRTAVEETLAQIWAGILQTPVGAGDNFFALGGHSLIATQIISRVRDVYGVEIPLRAIFESPRLSAFAARIEEALGEASEAVIPPIQAAPAGEPPVPSFAQERMWFLHQLSPESSAYNVPLSTRIRGALDLDALVEALNEVVGRHAVLRSRFVEADGRPQVEILPEMVLDPERIDLRHLSADEREAEAWRRVGEDSLRPFDLARDPLIRLFIVQMGEEDHILALTLHHIVWDLWSFGAFGHEWSTAYQAILHGEAPDLPPLPVQYSDYARWQRQWLRGEALDKQLAYWKTKLGGELPALDLPSDRPRPAVQTYRGAKISHAFSEEFSQALKTLSQSQGASLFMTMLGALKVQLSRLLGCEDVLAGTPIAGRTRREAENLIGLFVNTLVLRTDLAGEPAFSQVLKRVRETSLGAFAHQDMPFAKLVEELHPDRDLARTPLFQVMFNHLSAPISPIDMPGLRIEPYVPYERESKFDLTLYMGEQDGRLQLLAAYNADLFDEARVEEMLAQYQRILEQALEHPDLPVSRYSLATDRSAKVLPDPYAPLECEAGELFLQRFHRIAVDHAASVAIGDSAGEWTYAGLESRANRLAHSLRGIGVGRGDVVLVHAPRGAALVASMLGVWKGGAAFCILDPAYPAARLIARAQASGAKALIHIDDGEGADAERMREFRALFDRRIIRISSAWADDEAALSGLPDVDPGIRLAPDDMAYVAFTSGTTGEPKAVAGDHGPIAHFLRWHADTFDLSARDAFSLLSGLSHDPLLRDVLAPLWLGAALHIPAAESMQNPARLAEWMRQHHISVAHLTPAMGALVAQARPDAADAPATLLPALRYAFFGGDALGRDDVRVWHEVAPKAECVNFYGAMETPQAVAFHRHAGQGADEDGPGAPIPIGEGIGGVQLLILNRHGRPCGIGELGEICVRTAFLTRGYANDSDLTRERYLPDLFGQQPGVRIYRTGDLGRYGLDGAVTHCGRADRQVHVRGYRVELGEIEAALERLPAVRQAVANRVRSDSGATRIAAWLVAEDAALDVEMVRDALARQLPGYMIPASFAQVASIPLTPNGKVDFAALPDPQPASADAYVAPRTAIEETLAEIWAGVLQVSRAGANDNFFALGGHSLLATQIISRVRDVYQVEIPLRAIFESPRLSAFAERIEAALAAKGASALPPIAPAGDAQPPVPSFAQERMWFLQQLAPESSAYNVPLSRRLRGRLDAGALIAALNAIVRRHDVLRTQFFEEDGRPQVRIAPESILKPEITDLRHLPLAEREAEALRIVGELSMQPFDLASDSLIRLAIIRLDDEDHVLALALHHIVWDLWSFGAFGRELGEAYGAILDAREPDLPPLPVQYGDYARWQREWLSGETLQSQLAYWKEKLGGELPMLDLPTDHPRPAVQTYRGAKVQYAFSEELSAAVKALSQSQGASLFMTMLGALKAQLSRLLGSADILVGTPIAGRTRREIENLIGLFVNTLVLRTDLGDEPTFRQLLGRVRETSLGAFAHQDMPFAKLVEELHPDRDLSRTPLFQVLFNHLSAAVSPLDLPGLEIEPFAPYERESKFDLTLYMGEMDGRIQLLAVYNADLFEAPRIEEMLAQYQSILEQAVAAPDQPLSRMSLVTDSSRAVLPDPSEALCHEAGMLFPARFEQVAGECSAATAIEDSRRAWTYGDLWPAANRLSHVLGAMGVEKGDVVLVHAPRCADLAAVMLGVWKAGAAFCILDPAYPAPRLIARAKAAGAKALVRVDGAEEADAALLAAFDSLFGAHTLVLPAGGEWLDAYPESNREIAQAADDLAYIAFTSGTTGEPKAVAGMHGPLAHFLEWHVRTFALENMDRFTMLSGLSHDPLLRDVLTPLWLGARLCVPDAALIQSPPRLVDWMRREQITVAHLTPAMGSLIAQARSEALEAPDSVVLPDLRYAFFGGDVLSTRGLRVFHDLAPAAECINFYGAMETPQAMGVYRHAERLLSGAGSDAAMPAPIGRGIDGVQMLVLNSANALCGVGEVGEVCVRTAFLARGYANDEDLTSEKFIPDLFGADPHVRIYRTGDLGRYALDGAVVHCGRADRQVHVRGYRVELGEIESAMERLPEIGRCVAGSIVGPSGENRIVAWFECAADGADVAALRSYLSAQLPDYMIPASFVQVGSIPLTPNGKIDYRALPKPEAASAEVFVAPRTHTEETLARIWADVLRVDRVGMHDNFFALGGHSLIATQVMSRVQKILGAEMPLRTLFESPTVAALAARIDASDASTSLPAITPQPHLERRPLSFSQERMWFIQQLMPKTVAYNMGSVVKIRGPLNIRALEDSFRLIAMRHDILRTTFPTEDGVPYQRVHDEPSIRFERMDLTDVAQEDRQREAVERAQAMMRQPYDLREGPLTRIQLARIGDGQHILALSQHHIVSDQWSFRVMGSELVRNYHSLAQSAGKPDMPPLAVQYGDYSVWQRQWMRGEVLQEQLDYWTQRLANPPVLDLPTDRPRPAVRSSKGSRERLRIPPELAQAARDFCIRQSVTPFMMLLAAYKIVLSRYAGQRDLVVGVPIANRNRLETEGLIGTFVNMLAMRSDLSDNPPFIDYLRQVRELTLDAYAHQDLPFERLVEALQPERDLSHSPLFQVMFNLVNAPSSGARFSDLIWEAVPSDRGASQFDLSLSVDLEVGRNLLVEYDTDLFDAATARRFLRHYLAVLESVVRDPSQPVLSIPLLEGEERREILRAWNDTAREIPAEATLVSLFEKQAREHPDRAAVSFEGGVLTYGELDRRSSQLAHQLRASGLGPGQFAGIYMDRSLEMMVALLGVVKSGAAYLPLDPAFPRDRLAFMIEETCAPVILSQPHLLDGMPEHEAQAILLDQRFAALDEWPDSPVPPTASVDDLAYVIFTSGSTGKPKGVQIPHRALLNFLLSMQREPGLAPDDVLLAVTTLSFDIAGLELFLPLITGARIALASRDAAVDAAQLDHLLAREGATVMQATPATWRMMIEAGWKGAPSLKVLCGGEGLPRELAEDLLERCGELWNMYGPTETTIWSTVERIEKGFERITIGRPIDNTQVYVVDEGMQPVPPGVAGELLIGGLGVAEGYLGRLELTAEKFIPDPFIEGQRLYRTGDLARFLPDGRLECAGRIDHQVKIRGFRIELGEIESVLASHPSVEKAVVVAREDTPGGRRLVAYVVPCDAQELSLNDLRPSLRQSLPDYMVPSALVVLDGFPLTPNGKIDRRALPAPDRTALAVAPEYVAPRTPVEQTLARIWQELLGVERVGIHDNFFDLGGHSLLATQAISRLRRSEFPVDLPLRAMFEHATIGDLADDVMALMAGQDGDSELASLMELVKDLSPEEIAAKLAQMKRN